MKIYKILGVGHPRTGTGYTANLLSSWGLNVGHEIIKDDGVVAWQYVNEFGPWPWIKNEDHARIIYEHLVYNVRNPLTAIPSIVYTEDTNPVSMEYRKNTINVIQYDNPVDTAIDSIIKFDERINNMFPNIIFRIEDQVHKLFEYFSNYYPLIDNEYDEIYNSREHDGIESLTNELENCLPTNKIKINKYCKRYGYPKLF